MLAQIDWNVYCSTKATQNKLYVLPQLAHTVWVKFRKKTHKILFLVFFVFIHLGFKGHSYIDF